MISPKELKEMADNYKLLEGGAFLSKIIPEIEKSIISLAKSGNYEIKITGEDRLNIDNNYWLTEFYLYKTCYK